MNLKDKNIILHVGAHKTATTFLQDKLFINLKNTYCHIRKHKFNLALERDKKKINPIYQLYDFEEVLKFDELTLEEFKKNLRSYLNQIEEKNIIISAEGLVGTLHNAYSNNKQYVAILKKLLPEAKIVLVIRKEDDWFQSVYNQLVIKKDRYISLKTFLGYKNGNFQKRIYFGHYFKAPFDVRSLNWLNIFNNFTEAFGNKRVLLLPYEMFQETPDKFLEYFYIFTNITPYYPDQYEYLNKSYNQNNYTTKMTLYNYFFMFWSCYISNRIIRNYLKNNDEFFVKILKIPCPDYKYEKEIVTSEMKQKLNYIFSDSNKKLSSLININLGLYGYY